MFLFTFAFLNAYNEKTYVGPVNKKEKTPFFWFDSLTANVYCAAWSLWQLV